jgi:hypothetical protein
MMNPAKGRCGGRKSTCRQTGWISLFRSIKPGTSRSLPQHAGGASGDKSKSATPKRAVGLLHLPMGDENRRLNIALDNPQKMRPNQPLTVKVKASVKEGAVPQKVNVLVSAVDSGVLNITDYVTPDPWQAFFGQKRYGADIYDIYGQVIEGQGVWPRCASVVMVMNSSAAANRR